LVEEIISPHRRITLSKLGLFCAILASVLWGVEYALAERVYKDVSVYTVLFHSSILSLILMPVLAWNHIVSDTCKLLQFSNLTFWYSVIMIIGMLASIMIAKSIQLTNATAAGLIEISYPFFIILFSFLFFGKINLTKELFIGGVFIFTGIAVILSK